MPLFAFRQLPSSVLLAIQRPPALKEGSESVLCVFVNASAHLNSRRFVVQTPPPVFFGLSSLVDCVILRRKESRALPLSSSPAVRRRDFPCMWPLRVRGDSNALLDFLFLPMV